MPVEVVKGTTIYQADVMVLIFCTVLYEPGASG